MTEPYNTISLDCSGKLCPAPILELAKLAKKQNLPTIISIVATDDNFPADLEAWCRSTKHRLRQIAKDVDGVYTAQVEIGEIGASFGMDEQNQPTDAFLLAITDLDSTNTGIEIPYEPPRVQEAHTANIQPSIQGTLNAGPVVQATPVVVHKGFNAGRPSQAKNPTDLCGLPTEQALLQLSSVVLKASTDPLQVISDAPEFSEKLQLWATLIGVRLLDVQCKGKYTMALIARTSHNASAMIHASPEPQRENRASLCVMHNSFEALYVAMMMANSSTSQGIGVDIFFCFWGVALLRADKPLPKKNPPRGFLLRFFQGVIQFLTPKGPRRQKLNQLHFGGIGDQMLGYIIKEKQAQTLDALFQSAVEQNVRFLVCNTSLGLLGLTKEDLMVLPNIEIAGMTAFTELARKNSFSFTF
jgi:peroxiredoxin family protein/TusA-related sulfurtransferase